MIQSKTNARLDFKKGFVTLHTRRYLKLQYLLFFKVFFKKIYQNNIYIF